MPRRNPYPQSPPPRPVSITTSCWFASSPTSTSVILIRTLRCRKGSGKVGGRGGAIGRSGSVISVTIPVKTASGRQPDWHGGFHFSGAPLTTRHAFVVRNHSIDDLLIQYQEP